MPGIIFLKTNNLIKIIEFYTSVIGATIWLEQDDCVILKQDNMLFGFCEKKGDLGTGWLLTFFYQTVEEVDKMYKKMKTLALNPPEMNDKYKIYQFFAKDPEGRDLEFQVFLHDIDYDWRKY